MNRRRFLAAALGGVAAAACSRNVSRGAAEARRIVSVTPATTEALFAIGAGERVVGRSRFCDWPPEAVGVPIVGGYVDLDLEAILERSPDLVVGAAGPSSPRLQAQLEARAIPSWFPELDSCNAIGAMITGLGDRAGHRADAQRVAGGVHQGIDRVHRAVAALEAPRVLLLLQLSPLVASGPSSFLDELLSRAQAANVVRAGPPWQTLGLEQVVELDPALILDATTAPGEVPPIDPGAPGWRSSSAARAGHVTGVKDSRLIRPGPRVAEGLAVLAHAIHPQAVIPPV
jgi:iron complex transport system substrate-binding protein